MSARLFLSFFSSTLQKQNGKRRTRQGRALPLLLESGDRQRPGRVADPPQFRRRSPRCGPPLQVFTALASQVPYRTRVEDDTARDHLIYNLIFKARFLQAGRSVPLFKARFLRLDALNRFLQLSFFTRGPRADFHSSLSSHGTPCADFRSSVPTQSVVCRRGRSIGVRKSWNHRLARESFSKKVDTV